jgi:UDP-N-acetylmuramoyl-tripeptide--D-alanyl-D-alanine ligase
MGWEYSLEELAAVAGGAPQAPAPTTLRFVGISTDTRKIAPGQVFFALKGERFDGDAYVAEAFARGAAAAVCTQAHPEGPCVVVEDALKALQDFAVAHRNRISPHIIAITGSCGKTSSKDLVHALLSTRFNTLKTQGNLNNTIGVPLTLLEMDSTTQCAVVEMGADHIGEIRELCAMARPQESAVTLVAPAHLAGFGSIERIAAAKYEIAEGLSTGGTFYVNTDNAYTRAMGEKFSGRKIYFGAEGDVAIKAVTFDDTGEMLLDLAPVGRLRLPLPVKAHAHNVALAVAIALQNGVTEFEAPLREACARAVRFKVLRVGALEVIDDTYNANPVSMAAAVEALGMRPGNGKKIAALGEMLELGPDAARLHREIGEAAARHGVSALFARGAYAAEMAAAARAAGVELAEAVQDHGDIAGAITAIAAPGDVVLLKGSRGMRMELVLEALRERCARAEAGGRP